METDNIKTVKLEQKYLCQNDSVEASLPWVIPDPFWVAVSSISGSVVSFPEYH